MLNQKDLSNKMSKDIDEMKKMLNDYLQFAKQKLKKLLKIELFKMLEQIKSDLNNENFQILGSKDIIIQVDLQH